MDKLVHEIFMMKIQHLGGIFSTHGFLYPSCPPTKHCISMDVTYPIMDIKQPNAPLRKTVKDIFK